MSIAAAMALVFGLAMPVAGQDGSSLGEPTIEGLAEFLNVQTDLRVVSDFGPPYQFADDPDGPAQRDEPFAMFEWVFSGVFLFPEGLDVNCGFTAFQWSTFCGAGFDGVDPVQPYVVLGGVTAGVIPESGPDDAVVQYSFPFTYRGAVSFEPIEQFPGDTWQWTSYQPWVQADLGDGWSYNTSQWDGTRFLAPVSGGFGWVSAEGLYVAVPTSEIRGLSAEAEAAIGGFESLVAEDIGTFTEDNIVDAFEGFAWASAVHIHTGDFGVTNPSKIQAGPPKPHGPDDLFQGVSDSRPFTYPRLFPGEAEVFDYDRSLPATIHLTLFEDTAGFTWEAAQLQYGWQLPTDAFDRLVLEQFILAVDAPPDLTETLQLDACAQVGSVVSTAEQVACNDAMAEWFGSAVGGQLAGGDGLFTLTLDVADTLTVAADGDRFVFEVFFDWLEGGADAEGPGAGADARFGLSNDGGPLVASSRRWDSGTGSWVEDPLRPFGYQTVDDAITLWLTRSMFGDGNPRLGVVASWGEGEATAEVRFKTDLGVLETGTNLPFAAEESTWTAVFAVPETVPAADDGSDGGAAADSESRAEAVSGDGSDLPWLIALGAGVVFIAAGGWLFATGRRSDRQDCDRQKAAWDEAATHLREVRWELDEYKADLDENIGNINRTRRELAKLHAARRTSGSTDGGDLMHPLREGLISAAGLEQLIGETGRLLETYEEHLSDRRGRYDRALIRFDAARQREHEAREVYGECIGGALSAPIEANDPPPPITEEPAPVPEEPPPRAAPRPPVIEFEFEEPQPTPPSEPQPLEETPDASPPAPEPIPPPAPVVRGPIDGPDPSPGLSPATAGEPLEFCDWAFYVKDGGSLRLIRPPGPGAHECCRYVLTITSTPGQALSNAGMTPIGDEVVDPRDSSVIAHNAYKGADSWGRAQVRTWPEGAIAAMFGEGWPTVNPSPEDWPPVYEDGSTDLPDLAAFTYRPDQTDITVEFTDGCGNSGHAFAHTAGSRIYVEAEHECTNRQGEPECPVELTVSGKIRAAATGSMSYPIIDPGAVAGSEGDDLPSRIIEGDDGVSRLHVALDRHGHPTSEDTLRRLTLANTSRDVHQVGDVWHGRWTHSSSFSAGLRVPGAVRENTDRVTARITGDIAHRLDLTGWATPDHESCACGRQDCRCMPRFRLLVDSGDARVEIDGRAVVSLYRPDDPPTTPTGSSEVLWTASPSSSSGMSRPEPERPAPPG